MVVDADQMPDSRSETIFDRAKLAESAMDDPEFEAQLLEVFGVTGAENVREYEVSLLAGADQAAHRAAHSMKGSARALGMLRLGQVAESLEKWVKEGCIGTAPFTPEQFRNEYELALRTAIAEIGVGR
jgi:HPt (histidine-containing phosphotransfer) domain-containing protein